MDKKRHFVHSRIRMFLLPMLLCGIATFSATVNGNNAYIQKIDRGKLAQVEKKLNKQFPQAPKDIALNYAMAHLLLQPQYAQHNLEEAYAHIQIAIGEFNREFDERRLKKLAKNGITYDALQAESNAICHRALEEATRQNTVDAFAHFLRHFVKSPQTYIDLGIERRNQAAFRDAKQADTVGAFQDFMKRYPDAKEYADAVQRRNARAFSETEKQNTVEAYERFAKTYPDAKEHALALERGRKIAYVDAVQRNTIEAFQRFLDVYPSGTPEHLQAEKHRNALAFQRAKEANTIEAFQDFMNAYPRANERDEAEERRNNLALQHAKATHTAEGYAHFLAAFPYTPFEEEVQALWETRLYEEAVSSGNSANLIAIAEKHPDNRHAAKIIDSILQLEQRNGYLPHVRYAMSKGTSEQYLRGLQTYYKIISSDGELLSLELFKKNFSNDVHRIREFEKDWALAQMAYAMGLSTSHAGPAKDSEVDLAAIKKYIKLAAPKALAFVALQGLISEYVYKQQWSQAASVAKAYKRHFAGDPHYANLLQLLQSRVDQSVKISRVPNVSASAGHEYVPVISADNTTLYFCGRDRPDNLGGEDIFVSHFVHDQWRAPQLVRGLSTSSTNDGPMALSADGNTMIFFRSGKLGYADKTRSGWGPMQYFPAHINAGSWNSDAMISSDGQALFFASIREENYNFSIADRYFYHGNHHYPSDIYVSLRSGDLWGEPINLGPMINTHFSDRSPFLHPDMKTLYFSSDGHGGLGSYDVFKSTRLADDCWDCWSEPINLGKEINTIGDDWGYKISTDGTKAYFAKTDATAGVNKQHWLNQPRHLRPDYVATLTGRLVDAQQRPISAVIRWEDLESQRVIGHSTTDPSDGSYFIVLPLGKLYGYYVESPGYFPISNNVDLRSSREPIAMKEDIPVVSFKEMQEKRTPVRVNNLFFNFGESKLLPYSIPELKRVAEIIQRYQSKVEISGHTDNIGTAENNQVLSEQRAKAVKDFLVSQGCDAALLNTIGYGFSRPVMSNDTDAGRAKNRRVELRFVK